MFLRKHYGRYTTEQLGAVHNWNRILIIGRDYRRLYSGILENDPAQQFLSRIIVESRCSKMFRNLYSVSFELSGCDRLRRARTNAQQQDGPRIGSELSMRRSSLNRLNIL